MHSRAERVILFSGFRNVCPIHFHFLLLILSSIRHCCVLSHRSSFEMTSGQRIFRILLKHLLIKVCNFLVSSFLDLHVSEPYRRVDFTFVLKILSLVCNLINFSFHTGISIENVDCAFLILAVMSSSAPPGSLMMLPKYVNSDTLSIASP